MLKLVFIVFLFLYTISSFSQKDNAIKESNYFFNLFPEGRKNNFDFINISLARNNKADNFIYYLSYFKYKNGYKLAVFDSLSYLIKEINFDKDSLFVVLKRNRKALENIVANKDYIDLTILQLKKEQPIFFTELRIKNKHFNHLFYIDSDILKEIKNEKIKFPCLLVNKIINKIKNSINL